MARAFRHRTGFGAWINDTRNETMAGERWPYAAVDDRTVTDCIAALELQAAAGFNEFDVFGLFASYAWPLDIVSAVDDDRARRVRAILDAAHRLDVRVICGLGVYSWGFDTIIAQRPDVRGTNPHAMCPSRPASWDWMQRVIDFILGTYDVDGFHLESSDQGRCTCLDCASLGNVEYHCAINARAAEYIRGHWPDKTLMVNMCGYAPWGAELTAAERDHLRHLGGHLDYLIDPGHVGKGFVAAEDLSAFIRDLPCAYGTSGGAWIYPPQRWDRLRWFLPYTQRSGSHIRQLYADGGRAVEFYLGPTANPGVEMNIAFGGRLLADVDRSDDDILGEAIETLYRPRTSTEAESLRYIFQRAEAAYYDNFHPYPPRTHEVPGELHLAPMFGVEPGAPIYLYGTRPDDQPMDSVGLAAYHTDLTELLREASDLAGTLEDEGRTGRVVSCIRSVLADIEGL